MPQFYFCLHFCGDIDLHPAFKHISINRIQNLVPQMKFSAPVCQSTMFFFSVFKVVSCWNENDLETIAEHGDTTINYRISYAYFPVQNYPA